MDIKVKKTWDDITVEQYMILESMEKTEYPELIDKGIFMVDTVYEVDSRNIPYTAFNTLLNSITQIYSEKPPRRKAKPSYTINGTKYQLDIDYANFTTAQFVDFTNYQKDPDYIGMLSVVLIPDGHSYCDGGYDLEKVKEDLATMSVTDAMAVVGFFWTASTRFIKFILNYLTRKLKRDRKLPREQKTQIVEQIVKYKTLLDSFLASSPIAK